ncbi:hypothetical protein ZWY2020_007083 [Hordeum vulgare]|nr:hypothetical protein ZWY2020_007083 [Hordeum vulgare]
MVPERVCRGGHADKKQPWIWNMRGANWQRPSLTVVERNRQVVASRSSLLCLLLLHRYSSASRSPNSSVRSAPALSGSFSALSPSPLKGVLFGLLAREFGMAVCSSHAWSATAMEFSDIPIACNATPSARHAIGRTALLLSGGASLDSFFDNLVWTGGRFWKFYCYASVLTVGSVHFKLLMIRVTHQLLGYMGRSEPWILADSI